MDIWSNALLLAGRPGLPPTRGWGDHLGIDGGKEEGKVRRLSRGIASNTGQPGVILLVPPGYVQ